MSVGKVVDDILSIESEKDLRKRNLSLSDYFIAQDALKDLAHYNKTCFIQKSVKEYFESFDIPVIEQDGIYHIILMD